MANSVERVSKGIKVKIRENTYQNPSLDSPSPSFNKSNHRSSPKRGNKGTSQGASAFYKGLLWGAAFSLTASISAIIGATVALVSPVALQAPPILEKIGWSFGQNTDADSNLNFFSQYRLARPVNILIMGIDRVPQAQRGTSEVFAGRSDTMLLLRFNPEDNSVRMLSIPRDTRVEIPGVGFSKINDANVHGGPALAARVVSKTLNDVPIDRYVRVTTDAFIELVNLVGGVEVFVPVKMSYRDVTQKLEINLEAGWQTLNGEQAEQFARFRSDQYGDIGRVQRQQILLKALQKRLYSPAMLPRIPQAMQILQQYIDTNLSLEEILALGNFGRELKREDIKMVMLPGRFSQQDEYSDHRSYWLISQRQTTQVMSQYFAQSSGQSTSSETRRAPQKVRIAIQNASDDPGLANQVVQYLAQQNYTNVYLIPESPQLLRETEIVAQKGDLTSAETLKSLLDLGRVEASSTGDLDSDITLRIGLDAKQLIEGNTFVKDSSGHVGE